MDRGEHKKVCNSLAILNIISSLDPFVTCTALSEARTSSDRLALGSSLLFLQDVFLRVLQECGDEAFCHGSATLPDDEELVLLERQWVVQFHLDFKVVAWHCHLGALGQGDIDGAIGRSHEGLWPVPSEEWLRSASLVGLEHVDLSFEVSSDLQGVGLDEAHASLDLLLQNTSEEHANVVAGLGLVRLLMETLDTGHRRRQVLSLDTDDVHVLIDLRRTLLDRSRHDAASSRNINGLIDRHKELFFHLTWRHLKLIVHSLNQFLNCLSAKLAVLPVQGAERRPLDERRVIAVVVILGEQLSHLHLDELVHFFVLDHVALVQEDNNIFDTKLPAKQDVLPSLRHGTVGGGHDEDAAVHSGGAGNHIFNIICVTRAVNVAIVPIVRLVLDRGCVDCDTSCLLLRSLVNIGIVLEL